MSSPRVELFRLASRSDSACSIDVEDKFGPAVQGCYDGLDFTLLFEEAFLSIAPLGLFIILGVIQGAYLWKQNVKVRSGALHILKLVRVD